MCLMERKQSNWVLSFMNQEFSLINLSVTERKGVCSEKNDIDFIYWVQMFKLNCRRSVNETQAFALKHSRQTLHYCLESPGCVSNSDVCQFNNNREQTSLTLQHQASRTCTIHSQPVGSETRDIQNNAKLYKTVYSCNSTLAVYCCN